MNMNTQHFYIALFFGLLLSWTGCTDSHRESLDMPEEVAILSFSVDSMQASISADTIRLTLQRGTDLSALAPIITLTPGASVNPQSGEVVNFAQHPVNYRVTSGDLYRDYCVIITTGDVLRPVEHGRRIGYINWEDTENTTGQEAAWTWLQETYADSCDLLSLWDIQHGWVDMNQYAVIWYHTRGVEGNGTLPFRAYDPQLVEQMKAYANTGGRFLLTGMAPRWLETLSLVQMGCAPNNFYGHENFLTDQTSGFTPTETSHPIFHGLPLVENKVMIMGAGCTIENNTSAWYLAAWGGYSNDVKTWESRTGGKALATDLVDGNTVTRVVMAEFPSSAGRACHCITINSGLYDWAVNTTNSQHEQLEQLTQQTIDYLRNLKTTNK